MFPWNILFPFIQKNNGDALKKAVPNDVQSFINQLLSQVIPANMQQMMERNQGATFQNDQDNFQSPMKKNHPLNAEVFETHSEVYVRILLRDPALIKNVKIYHTSNQSIIEGIPLPEDKHIITLPAIVKKKGSSAKYKDEMLEIKFVKNLDFQYSQIDVSEI